MTTAPSGLVARTRRTAAFAFKGATAGLLLASSPSPTTLGYLRRFVLWSPSGVDDWRRFPSRPIARAEQPHRYPEHPADAERAAPLLREVTYSHGGLPRAVVLDAVLEETGTTAFIVIQDGAIVRESYLNGHRRDSLSRAFSVSKSFTSALVGVALAEGRIGSLDDPFVRYVPELRGRGYDAVTIRHLLLMAGGFRFSYGRLPWRDSPRLYWHPDLRRVLLEGPPRIAAPGERFNYSDYSTALLGLVLERATGGTVSGYFERNVWQPLGAEYDARWSIDHEGDGLEYTPSGLNARAIDLAKLGSLYLEGGRWNGRQILPRSFTEESVSPLPSELPGHSAQETREDVFYKFGWWGHRLGGGRTCFFANGYRAQLIYVCPEKRLVIARFGRDEGSVQTEWPMLLRAIAERMP